MSLPKPQDTPTGSSQPEAVNPSPNYATAAKQTRKITNESAIIIEKTVEADYEEYITALGEHVPGSKMLTLKPSSHNKLIVWLDSKKTVDDLIEKKIQLIVAHQRVNIRPYNTRNKRITFSPVYPQVEDEFLVAELAKYGITTKNPITTSRAGFKQKQYAHMTVTKRHTYIDPTDVPKLPTRFITEVEGNPIWVYVTTDSALCYTCNKEGHLARNCPNKPLQKEHADSLISSLEKYTPSNQEFPELPGTLPNDNNSDRNDDRPLEQTNREDLDPKPQDHNSSQLRKNKKPPSTISSLSSGTTEIPDDMSDEDICNTKKETKTQQMKEERLNSRQPSKRQKTSDGKEGMTLETDNDDWTKVEDQLSDKAEEYPLDAEELKKLVRGLKVENSLNYALTFTKDLFHLQLELDYVLQGLPTKTMKDRVKRLMKKINEHMEAAKNVDKDSQKMADIPEDDNVSETNNTESEEDSDTREPEKEMEFEEEY